MWISAPLASLELGGGREGGPTASERLFPVFCVWHLCDSLLEENFLRRLKTVGNLGSAQLRKFLPLGLTWGPGWGQPRVPTLGG